MSKWKATVVAVAVLLFCAGRSKADTTPVVLTFEGVGDLVPINDFYNGGAGGSLGISFGADALAVVSSLNGGSGAIANLPSGDTAAFFLSGTGDLMNVAAGFTTGFSFFYSAAFLPGSVTVWSGLDGTGTMLASLSLPSNGSCSVGPAFCFWTPIGVTFAGTAQSVNFSGTANAIAFDDVTVGSSTAGGGPTPTPEAPTMLLLGAGSLGLLGARRRKSA